MTACPKFEYFRSRKHLDAIKSLPCCVCGTSPVDPAHSNSMSHGKGRGIKSSDEFVIPLCRVHHQNFDNDGGVQSRNWFMKKLKETVVTLRSKNKLLEKAELLLIERGVL